MTTVNASQSKDDQLSEKSAFSEPPARIEDIFEWIEGIPLSKTTKNLARDFSDAVLMAEILKFYYPHIVSAHNYIPVNSIQNKKENWNTLNRKVLSKIDMKLAPEMIDQLAHSQPGVIDKLLNDFRDKQMSYKVKGEHVDEARLQEIESESCARRPVERGVVEEQQPLSRSFFGRIGSAIYNFFACIFGIILAILCFWRWFARKPRVEAAVPIEQTNYDEIEAEQLRREQEEAEQQHLRESYEQAMEELRVKADVIKTLCHKVAFLEGTMKLKDMKITTLTTQLEQQNAAVDAIGSIGGSTTSRPSLTVAAGSLFGAAAAANTIGIPNSNQNKIRKRPRTQM